MMLVIPPTKSKGFTLIELLIVVAIIGVLSALGIGAYMLGIERAREARAKGDINRIVKAARQLDVDTGLLPNKEASSGCGMSGAIDTGGNNEIYFIPNHASLNRSGLFANFSTQAGVAVPVASWKGPYLDGTINNVELDPWGQPYVYDGDYECRAGVKGCERFVGGTTNDRAIFSTGKDEEQYTADDIVYVFCGAN